MNGDANSEGHTVKEAHSHALRLAEINTGEKHQFCSDFTNFVAITFASAPKQTPFFGRRDDPWRDKQRLHLGLTYSQKFIKRYVEFSHGF